MCEKCQKCKNCSHPQPQPRKMTRLEEYTSLVLGLVFYIHLGLFKALIMVKMRKKQIEQWNLYVEEHVTEIREYLQRRLEAERRREVEEKWRMAKEKGLL